MAKTTTYKQAWIRLRSKTNGQWFVHPDLRDRLIEQAKVQGTNLTDVAAQILCDHVGVPRATSSRQTAPRSDQDLLNFRIPRAAYLRLCQRFPTSWQDGARKVLCEHFGLAVPRQSSRQAA